MGDLAIRIGAGSEVYKDVALAYSMRRGQKLSISGTGEDLYTALTTNDATKKLGNFADGIGTIKSSSDIILSAAEVTSSKAALLKLGTKSLVLQGAGAGGVETALNVRTTANFQALDATYTKFKSMNISGDLTLQNASDLNGVINLQGIEKLSGKGVSVSASASDIALGMSSLLKNINNISKITVSSGNAEFTVDQLRVLGDKLDKSGGGTIRLKDTADKLLQTSSIALINKLNNTNINSGVPLIVTIDATSDVASGVITSNGHTLNTGDKVTYIQSGSAAIDTLADATDYYVRKLDGNTFSLYDTKLHALNTSSMDGRKAVDNAGNGTTDRFVTSNADAPIRKTTLDRVDVKQASIAQVNQFTALTAAINNPVRNEPSRLMSDIIGNVEIKDTAAILKGGLNTLTLTTGNTIDDASGTSSYTILKTNHGYETGDAVYYEKADGKDSIGLSSKTTYYVGKVDTSHFVLFDTRAAALAGNNDPATAGVHLMQLDVTSAGHSLQNSGHSFTTSNIDKSMSAVGRYNANTGNVERVTIAGAGLISTTDLDSIAEKVKNGGGAAGGYGTKMTYSAKAIDIQSNMQALYDNMTKVGGTPMSEIVVADGVINGKKTLNISIGQYNEMFDAFSKGVTNAIVGGNADTPTNYAFNVTGAAYADSKKAGQTGISITNNSAVTRNTALQDDKNVASFSIVGLDQPTNGAGTGVTSLIALRDLLSQSKLKTVLTNSQSANNWSLADKTLLKTWVSNIGSNSDKNKLKVVV
jgi:hypothetical protein